MGYEFEGLVYRWAESPIRGRNDITILETSERDGTQASGIRYPSLNEKIALLEYMDRIGIEHADIAMPIARGRHFQEALELARAKQRLGLSINLVCLARSLPGDVERAIDLKNQSGTDLEVIIFKGSSPIRREVEGWEIERDIVVPMISSIEFAVKNGLKVTAATEDTTRSGAEDMKKIFIEAINGGATRLCIADTVGFSEPWSAHDIVSRIKNEVIGNREIGLDWHGHNDIGLSTANALIALGAGADRVHTTILGVGERAGNTPTELVLENLRQHGIEKYDFPLVIEYGELASKVYNRPIAPDHPILGKVVHKTSTGIHGAGIAKAYAKGRPDLAGIVYSSVDPHEYGREPELGVGPLSGERNAIANLQRLDIEPTKERIDRVLKLAQLLYKELDDDEIARVALMDENDFVSLEGNGNWVSS